MTDALLHVIVDDEVDIKNDEIVFFIPMEIHDVQLAVEKQPVFKKNVYAPDIDQQTQVFNNHNMVIAVRRSRASEQRGKNRRCFFLKNTAEFQLQFFGSVLRLGFIRFVKYFHKELD